MLSNSATALHNLAARKPAYFKKPSQATSLQEGIIVGQERRTREQTFLPHVFSYERPHSACP